MRSGEKVCTSSRLPWKFEPPKLTRWRRRKWKLSFLSWVALAWFCSSKVSLIRYCLVVWKTHRMPAQTAMWYLDTNLSHITLCLFVCFIGGFEKKRLKIFMVHMALRIKSLKYNHFKILYPIHSLDLFIFFVFTFFIWMLLNVLLVVLLCIEESVDANNKIAQKV